MAVTWLLPRPTGYPVETVIPPWFPCDSFPIKIPPIALSSVWGSTLSLSTRSTTMATETLPIHRPVNRNRERIFFSGMAILLCVVGFIGFSPTYFRAGMLRAPLPSPIPHVHGAVFTLLIGLFAVQAAIISARRV